ncbi:MAG: nicotinate-nucleotide adenylyltransferase, partial [Mycoplasma sp.]|nr:nicotinate-nucleotide adenylyltransferase [Mycoplasma sp.]
MKKIAIYGGKFDPIHNGHLEVARFAIKELDLDALYFVPSYINPFDNNKKSFRINHRVQMIENILEDKMFLEKYEINKKTVSYSIFTTQYFKQKFPNSRLFLLIGDDNVKKINKWKKIESLCNIASIIAFRRFGLKNKFNLKKYNIKLLNNKAIDYSSTLYKQGDLSKINQNNQKYIANNYLYLEHFVKNFNNNIRYQHCLNTASLAAQYAKNLKFDIKKAYYAGLVHDLTKNWSVEKTISFFNKFDYPIPKHSFNYHGHSAALWLEKVYLLNDKEFLQSIRVHTMLDIQSNKITTLDKIVFAADKLCKNRKWSGIQKIRKAIMDDFNNGFILLIEEHIKHLRSLNVSNTHLNSLW